MAGKVDVYLSMGSNLGRRDRNLEEAAAALDKVLGPRAAVSDVYETAPWGFESENPFLNDVVLYEASTDGWWKGGSPEPEEAEAHALWILDRCKRVEAMMGRTDREEYDLVGKRVYHDRPIDIDILFYGTQRIVNQRLAVPHRHMAERDFVMFPLRQVARPDVVEAFPDIFRAK